MTVSQKASLSLLISVFLFAGFTVLSFIGLFDLVEARFYNPSITKNLTRELQQDTKSIQDFFSELESRFGETIRNESVMRSFLPNQSAEDIFERSKLYGTLLESLGGLQSVRFIDAAGRRIHYSTLPSDILRQDRLSVSYRNYEPGTESFPYDEISVLNKDEVKLTLDSNQDRILFSLPFYDSYNIYRGTAVFSLSVRAVADRLLSEGLIKYGEDVSIVSNPAGIIIGLPRAGKDALVKAVASAWNEGIIELSPLDSGSGDISYALISAKTGQGIFTGKVVNESLFEFPFAMKLILLFSFFLTSYLTIFLLFNLRQDSMTVIQNRLKRLQLSLFEEYYDRKGNMDWARWSRELEQRREEVRLELKRGLKTKSGSQGNLDIDTLIDKSWDEMAAVMGSRETARVNATIDEEKLSSILNKVLAAASHIPAAGTAGNKAPQGEKTGPKEDTKTAAAEEPEELAEEIEEASAALAEELEELAEEVEEIPALEELEEVSGDIQDISAAAPEEREEPGEDGEEVAAAGELEELTAETAPQAAEALEELPEEIPEVPTVEQLMEGSSREDAEESEPGSGAIPQEGEEARQEKKHPSNIRLAFGDDDIPYIVETSGLELVEEDIESVISLISQNDKPAELEELGAEDGEAACDDGTKRLSEDDISKLASEIEFSIITEHDDEQEEHEWEIYSPMDNIIIEAGQEGAGEADTSPPGILQEIDPVYDMSLVYKPFQSENFGDPVELEPVQSVSDADDSGIDIEEVMDETNPREDSIIEERNGISYIIGIDGSDAGNNLDPNFKNLVDSVLNKE